jgi:acetyltransferase-like isoleucine patch superfamily enzyme
MPGAMGGEHGGSKMKNAGPMARVGAGWRSVGYLMARLQKKLRLSAIYGSEIHPTSAVEGGSQVVNSRMDRHSFCGYDCVILNAEIGSFCSIADNVYIGGSAHPMEFVSTSPVFLSHRDSVKAKFARHAYFNLPRTTVGNDVWVGYGALVRAGVHIGNGAVVGMGAVVTRDVPPYCVVAGNPAKKIRDRFPEHIAQGLLKSAWWTYGDEELRRAALLFNDPEAFLKQKGLI